MRRYTLYIICMLLTLPMAARKKSVKENSSSDDLKYTQYFMEAQRQLRGKQYDAAYELLNYCKEMNPDAAEALYFLAPLNMMLGLDSVATADMEKAVRLVPTNYWYADLLAKIHFGCHRPAQAIKVLEDMNRRWSDKQELMYMMLDAYASQNMTDSVLSVLKRLEVKDGKTDQISIEKVRIFTQQNNVEAILQEMEDLVIASPTTSLPADLLPSLLKEKADAFILLGDIYHKAGNDERAFQYYDSCLVYRPKDAMALNNYAYYLALQETKLDSAEIMSRTSNEIEPDNPTYLDTLAWILYLKGNYKEAKQYMDRTVQLMKPEELEEAEDVKEHLEKINAKIR